MWRLRGTFAGCGGSCGAWEEDAWKAARVHAEKALPCGGACLAEEWGELDAGGAFL